LLIIVIGLAAPVFAAVFAFRRPSLIYIIVLLGAGFLWLSPPWVAVTTYLNPDGSVNTVGIEWIGHGWGVSVPPDSAFQKTSYAIYWPQLYAEIALLVVVVTLLYLLLRLALRRERAAVGPP
jgi:hypothetical protein